MSQQQDRLDVLLKRYAENALDMAEQEELAALLQQDWNQSDYPHGAKQPDWEKMVQEITASQTSRPIRRINFLPGNLLHYAAAILLIIGSVTYIHYNNPKEKTPQHASQPVAKQNDVMPGADKAILTLSDGHQVALNSKAKQTITDGALAINNHNGTLIYNSNNKTDVVVQNTLSTPKGGQYELSLPDGSNVWLNAESSITFPTSFIGAKREVSITGEVYFEVSANPHRPFIVRTVADQITVLGTHFNVNSYTDEPSGKVSLVEGSVRVGNELLKPGDAYFCGKVSKTNLDQDLAWKNGVFSFDNTRIDAVMRQVSRWYNIKVHYPDGVPELIISGSMGRDLKLSQMLAGLEGLGVHASLENDILIVKL